MAEAERLAGITTDRRSSPPLTLSEIIDGFDHYIRALRALVHAQEPKPEPQCICPHFSDTGGMRIGDLCCPVHGVGGHEPLDGPWDEKATGAGSD